MPAKKTAAKSAKPKTEDLPGVDGPGVAPVRIPAVEAAAAAYFKVKERRCELTTKEVSAKRDLIDVLHANEEKIGRDSTGVLTYRYDDEDLVVRLSPGDEHLTVRSADKDGGGD